MEIILWALLYETRYANIEISCINTTLQLIVFVGLYLYSLLTLFCICVYIYKCMCIYICIYTYL